MECERLLPDKARTVFEWIGTRADPTLLFWFGEVKRDCGIDTDHELHTILALLEQYPQRVGSHWPIVKAVYPEEEHGEGAFEAGAHAARAWEQYCAWEREHLCPQCKKPLLKKLTVLRCQDPECGHEHDLDDDVGPFSRW